MQNLENLWPSSLGQLDIIPPVQILSQQAEYFNAMMQNVLQASVLSYAAPVFNPGSAAQSEVLVHDFEVKMPVLGNYSVILIKMTHDPLKLYPVVVEDKIAAKQYAGIDSEEMLIRTFKDIFNSPEMNRTISALLVQARHTPGRPSSGNFNSMSTRPVAY